MKLRRPLALTFSVAATVTVGLSGDLADAAGTPDSPAPVGTPFDYSDGYSGTSWTGTVLGFIELPRDTSFGTDTPGRCIGIIGTLAPTESEGLTSQPYSSPAFTAVSGGRAVDSSDSILECDYAATNDAGWALTSDATVTVGTAFAFVVPVFLAGDPAPDPELIAVGDTSSSDATYYQPTVLPALPPLPPPNTAPIDTSTALAVGAPFTYSDGYSGTSWSGTVLGYIDIPRDTTFGSDSAGRCIGIIGTLTPTEAEGLTAESYSTPTFAVVSGGRMMDPYDSLLECDYQPTVDAGWGVPSDAAVTVGTLYPFVQVAFIPGDAATAPDLIAVGDTSSTDAVYYQSTALPALPALPAK